MTAVFLGLLLGPDFKVIRIEVLTPDSAPQTTPPRCLADVARSSRILLVPDVESRVAGDRFAHDRIGWQARLRTETVEERFFQRQNGTRTPHIGSAEHLWTSPASDGSRDAILRQMASTALHAAAAASRSSDALPGAAVRHRAGGASARKLLTGSSDQT